MKIEPTGRCNFGCTFCARSMVLREQHQQFQALRAAHLRRDVTATACEECVAYR